MLIQEHQVIIILLDEVYGIVTVCCLVDLIALALQKVDLRFEILDLIIRPEYFYLRHISLCVQIPKIGLTFANIVKIFQSSGEPPIYTITLNRPKIINDPIYGFIQIPPGIIFDIIQHPVFQRLRRIRQLGFTNMVYHGAEHTRFQHAIGAFHLMGRALAVLRDKGVDITTEEQEAAQLAILLHDIGHGPYSHCLENVLLPFHHETLTLALLNHLNDAFNGSLDMAVNIFNGTYSKGFLHELVSSQLDMDRLDYLNRDRFFTGVYEGVIGYDRIIHMLNVVDDRLVVEEKGIYSVEKFLVARRLMYWQVYLHRTSLAAETMLAEVFRRAKELMHEDPSSVVAVSALKTVLSAGQGDKLTGDLLNAFLDLDDYDIFSAVKSWRDHNDELLSYLCTSIFQRNLFKTRLGKKQEIDVIYNDVRDKLLQEGRWDERTLNRLIFRGKAENSAYKSTLKNILILFKDGSVMDISEASENLDIRALSETVTKHFVSWPRS